MHQLSNAEAVTSGVASLILFSTTLFAGHALAEMGNAPPGRARTGTAVTQPKGVAPNAGSVRDDARTRSPPRGLTPRAAPEPRSRSFDLR